MTRKIIDLTVFDVADDEVPCSSSSQQWFKISLDGDQDGRLASFDFTPRSSSRSTSCTPSQSSSSTSNSPSTANTSYKRRKTDSKSPIAEKNHVEAIDLLDDEDEDLYHNVRDAYPLLVPPTDESLRHVDEKQFHIVDLTDDEERETARVIQDETRFDSLTHAVTVIDLEVDETAISINPNEILETDFVRIGSVNCVVGKAVEFSDGSFMRIAAVSKTGSDKIILTGAVFLRQNSFREKVPKRRNEVVWVGEVRREVCGDDLLRNRKLILTNRRYPDMSCKTHPDSWLDPDQEVLLGPLFCRWKRTTKMVGLRLESESWRNLAEEEADPGFETRISNGAKRFAFRQCTTIPGGSFSDTRAVINLDTNMAEDERVSQQYTFGDAFCGAGGTSCGAQMAGLKLVWSFDHDPKPLATYSMNFPNTEYLNKPVHEFISMAQQDYASYRVDVLHISPPCQPFSPAHTIPSQQRDEMNQAALFSVGELLESVRPRIVTIEETEGLVSRHGEWFAALIHIFIRIGYSVSWKIIKCGDYGIPQPSRKRLMIVAAGPGESLPDFPAATHSLNPNDQLSRIPTIGDRIHNLKGSNNHDTSALRRDRQRPFSPDTYAYTLTCNSGVGNYHPSGLRNYTVRELACLQTFPRTFLFADVGVTSQRRQIGNAVPPELAKALMKQIINSLLRSDNVL